MNSFYLNQRHFSAMVVAACLVHMAIALISLLLPQEQVVKVPVHVLNVKLGGGDVNALNAASGGGETVPSRIISSTSFSPPARNTVHASPAKPAPAPKPPKPKLLPKPVETPAQEEGFAAPPITSTTAMPAESPSAAALPFSANTRPSQYYRPGQGGGVGGGTGTGTGAGSGAGSSYGNSISPDAELMHRYTQLISMWVNRHKSIFTSALQSGMKGNIIVRLQIDRKGNIKYFKLDKATGVPAADAAAASMVRAANPVPPVPANYPGGNLFEFLISVGYTASQ